MKTLVLFYSYTGHTKSAAEAYAAEQSADVVEIKEIRRPSKPGAYLRGCFAALRGKSWPIEPLDIDPAYDRIVLYSPVWAGNPPPAVNAALAQILEGKPVSVVMNSASGKSECRERVEAAVKARGCTLERFEDIKAK